MEETDFVVEKEKQKVVALIPARGGSKGVPGKNIRKLRGKPLIYYALQAATDCGNVDEVWVSTNNEEIKDAVLAFRNPHTKVRVWNRPSKFATGDATTESVMLDFAGGVGFDIMALIQCTSPLMRVVDLFLGIKAVMGREYDSAFSMTNIRHFLWKGHGARVWPVNYEPFKSDGIGRPMRQDMKNDQIYRLETGAFYVTTKKALLSSRVRVSGEICAIETPFWADFEIDTLEDFENIGRLMG